MTNPQPTEENPMLYTPAQPWNADKTPWLEIMDSERDKYGRTVRPVHMIVPTTDERRGSRETTAVIVRMPKCYIEKYGKHNAYLVNVWAIDRFAVTDEQDSGKITYFAKLADAKNFAIQASYMAVVVRALTPFRFTKLSRSIAKAAA